MFRQRSNLVDYRKVKSHLYDGVSYDSKFEAAYAAELDLRVKANDIKSWERQVPIPIYLHEHLITTYKIDFIVTLMDGSKEFVECKGFFDNYARLRWKLFEAYISKEFPDASAVLVKLKSYTPRWKYGKR